MLGRLNKPAGGRKITLVLAFWFGQGPDAWQAKQASWWQKDNAFDRSVKEKFEPALKEQIEKSVEQVCTDAKSCLGFIILCDQFPRNMYRDTPGAFAYDDKARQAVAYGLTKDFPAQLTPIEQIFYFMPLMHSEVWADQEQALHHFGQIAETASENYKDAAAGSFQFAKAHADIVKEFGRYQFRTGMKSYPAPVLRRK